MKVSWPEISFCISSSLAAFSALKISLGSFGMRGCTL